MTIHQRDLTFIDSTSQSPPSNIVISFILLTSFSMFCALRAFHLGYTRSHYHDMMSLRLLFPFAVCVIAMECATLASTRRWLDELNEEKEEDELEGVDVGSEEDDDAMEIDDYPWIKFIFVLEAFEVPILLITTFELTYLIHKRRSVNFCGMYFDQGRRRHFQGDDDDDDDAAFVVTTRMKSFMLRNLIRVVALLLWLLGIVVNFDILGDVTTVDQLAGRAGWFAVFRAEVGENGEEGREWVERLHLLLSLIPEVVLVFVSFYLSIVLWGYGTVSSMVVHSSYLNPWFAPFFGTIALAGGQVFDEKWYPLSSNVGLLIFVVTLLLLMSEVDKDVVAANEFSDFLRQVSKKGNELTVKKVMGGRGNNNHHQVQQQHQQHQNHNHHRLQQFQQQQGGEHGVYGDSLDWGGSVGGSVGVSVGHYGVTDDTGVEMSSIRDAARGGGGGGGTGKSTEVSKNANTDSDHFVDGADMVGVMEDGLEPHGSMPSVAGGIVTGGAGGGGIGGRRRRQ